MKVTEHEMRGLLTGKCLPGDIRVNEELPAYLVRKYEALRRDMSMVSDTCDNWRKRAEEAEQKLDAMTEFRMMIFSTLGVHDSNENFVARVNIENALRRSDCLSAIERHFTIEVEDEEYDGEMMEHCPLNWGQEPSVYIETFKTVLNAVRAEDVRQIVHEAEGYENQFGRDLTGAEWRTLVGNYFSTFEGLSRPVDATKGGSDD